MMFPLFYGLRAAGFLRVSEEQEQRGLDEALHGGACYDAWEGPGMQPATHVVKGMRVAPQQEA